LYDLIWFTDIRCSPADRRFEDAVIYFPENAEPFVKKGRKAADLLKMAGLPKETLRADPAIFIKERS
jgi:hypothetical protein